MAEKLNQVQKNEFLPYKIVYRTGYGEYIEKKSKFIATVAPAVSENEVTTVIESVRKKYYDARHNCTAFIIGRNKELTRCSDDGEPSGTAGKPILEVLMGEDVTNVVVVVTRYFGGTLLGTGGLVRAYTQAAKAGLADAGIATMRYGTEMTLKTDYSDSAKIQYLLEKDQIEVKESRYTAHVEFDILVPTENVQMLTKTIEQLTCARVGIIVIGAGYYIDKKGGLG